MARLKKPWTMNPTIGITKSVVSSNRYDQVTGVPSSEGLNCQCPSAAQTIHEKGSNEAFLDSVQLFVIYLVYLYQLLKD